MTIVLGLPLEATGWGMAMSVMLDRLRRFRPVGTPGGAGPVGVPADDRSGVPAELVAVFAALDEVIAECQTIRTRAAQEAAAIVAGAERDATATIADARTRAAGERAEAAAAVRARGDAAVDRTLAAASAEADLLTKQGLQRMDGVVALVVDRIVAEALADGAG
ncbi:hypothetical protein ACIBL3_21595 [Kribbella sp. NPDC050124]|uniref:hypothetical protein n=1 Tax=Kribbella sp. NPDC050124 TaxID=3364114 RepID=UPI0037A67181